MNLTDYNQIRDLLTRHGFRFSKSLGQNFLTASWVPERIAESAGIDQSTAVLEIGPGIGGLTEMLARNSKHVTAYEIDENLIPVLHDVLSEYDNVEILLQDFLECDFDTKVKELKETYGSVSVCANLPYYVTTPILFRIFECPDIAYITVMVQKEVGERFAAKPGDSEYSALSAEGQYLFDVKKLFTVPGRSFNPSPNVDSVIIQFARKNNSLSKQELTSFFDLVRGCFKQRRKTIYNNLREYLDDAALARSVLEKAGIEEGRRAQQLSVDELRKIYEELQ